MKRLGKIYLVMMYPSVYKRLMKLKNYKVSCVGDQEVQKTSFSPGDPGQEATSAGARQAARASSQTEECLSEAEAKAITAGAQGDIEARCAILLAPLFLRYLDIEKSVVLNQNNADYDVKFTLSELAKQEILWWIENVELLNGKLISYGSPDFYLETDASMQGEFLPPQIIYGGKTDKCHPIYKFPSDWDITHSENHWVNTGTQMEYVKNIILPYIRKIKRSAKLNEDQKALCIFDVFRAQMGEDFLAFLDEKNIKVVFVPPCCTDRLQPLDVSVQKAVKNKMRNSFEQWYSNEIVKQLDGKEIVDSENEPIVPVDLSLTRLKPLSAKWLVQMFQHIKNNLDIVRSGFRETGISGALDDYLENELPLSKMSRDK
ncbi:unnamed protein product [Mytilus coruscus]|uniref:DDE-1 domain-containing protein n=1 Tax=Mytilus coruscus TaxID=42192 RepID=A0A6J8DZQ8_MYTCO|nr:unnamed protein product [Mytilus coruscus]